MRNKEEILNNGFLNHLIREIDNDEIFQFYGHYTDPITRKDYLVKFTQGFGWEHLSVSTRNKTPEWDVMCKLKEIFWRDDECCVEYHPKREDYVNNMPYCLHIWKKIDEEFEMPPSILVGFKDKDPMAFHASMKLALASMSPEDREAIIGSQGVIANRKMRRKNG